MSEVNVVQLVSTFGLSVGIAVYLVYWVTNKLSDKLDNLSNKMDKVVDNLNVVSVKLTEISTKLDGAIKKINDEKT